ncbi:beta-1,3-galactosyl-O-glycosyl-glycoprotein beta-1,6-N-acetylglucosaminyltransferase [Rhinatrema bivittatum]|uniref:beta-1,3-galactosyl-O-glycosyl-glycoprotein beta-1,6-N-acetylglucosaminyltransferase n=1 Tax=Rhinatrema bivittatum TaxID=194408 RepID=UPI00112CD548|nr:beta-1,3-galactosyl-O-glycosyl-glycoprotein beta-1,6-N-acetylglucosaminyltransferase [Rhinatrema bivittatum]XP_029472147.1 beta-1,3-galactosyl-O-glycosyl-glycoprotein beta-1,6-N-acetylglucosaminyltransferase [Rhinatrema bivittatum]XP_029472156.1 beta-1,3-galactosyl-O-glycosyl-glycoprotein beta-1,6-N-acetylglucosaminyltransferase [Rhinatrema bivittatum]XP_029472164.1 beta-1,3-galactosyl-O-glycosyl-glycoprotein beta-1,6-N-acetylglucosaminyltransferase [Rhinatrema bivittatum]XP_029472173.1 beta
MLKIKLHHCKVKRCKFLLAAVLTLVTLSAFKLHQKQTILDHRHLDLRVGPHSSVNCTKILRGDTEEIQKAKLELLTVKFRKRSHLTTDDYINMTKDCDYFTNERRYIMEPLTKEEEEFPIAYSVVVHHKIDMFERLLRSIYVPQNYYCIHVDKKSPESFLAGVRGIVSCFDNVFIASQLENVVYASWSRVQADLNCMKDLVRRSASWKYLINLCGMDFPVKTNQEIVEKLKTLKGENSLETEKMPSYKEVRWKKHHEIVDGSVKNMEIDKNNPPIQIPIFSGSAYFVINRRFVEYVLENSIILKFIEWAKDTYSPDEFLWATIQRIPEVPSSVPTSEKYDVSDMNSVARFVKWAYFEGDVSKGAPYPPCTGLHVRSVCVFGAGDLNWILQKHHFFANKFDTDVDAFAIQCLEEHLRDKALHWQTFV